MTLSLAHIRTALACALVVLAILLMRQCEPSPMPAFAEVTR